MIEWGEVAMIDTAVDDLKLAAQPSISKAQIEANYRTVRFDEGTAPVRFSMALPKDWGVLPDGPAVPTTASPVTVLGRAQPEDGTVAEITVFAAMPGIELHPADFLDAWMAQRNYVVADRREFETPFGRVADVVASKTEPSGELFDARLFALKDGALTYIVTGRAQRGAATAAVQDAFTIAIQTFALAEPSGQRFAEPFGWRQMANGDRALLPVSMTALPGAAFADAPGTAALAAAVPGGDGGRAALMVIDALPDGSEHAAAASLLSAMMGGDAAFVPAPPADVLGTAGNAWSVTHAAATVNDRTYHATIARRGTVTALLVSPARSDDAGAWARSRRAFEVMLETLGPTPSGQRP